MQAVKARPLYYVHMFHVEVDLARIQMRVLTIHMSVSHIYVLRYDRHAVIVRR